MHSSYPTQLPQDMSDFVSEQTTLNEKLLH